MCVCVCVWRERERGRREGEGERGREKENTAFLLKLNNMEMLVGYVLSWRGRYAHSVISTKRAIYTPYRD